jgi:hypothetical protein
MRSLSTRSARFVDRARLSRGRHATLDHGILEIDNNTAERAMGAVALGRKNYLFVGSQTGGKSAAIAYTLIETAKLNGIDPHAWLAETLARIPDHKITGSTKFCRGTPDSCGQAGRLRLTVRIQTNCERGNGRGNFWLGQKQKAPQLRG